MATDDRSGKYPDISGVFNIDDSEVPTNIILQKQPETPEAAAARAAGPVLFRQPGEAPRKPAQPPRREPQPERREPIGEPRREPAQQKNPYARAERPTPPAGREPVMLREADAAEARKAQKLAQEERQRQREEKRRQKRRAALIRRAVLLGALAVIAVIALAAAFGKPTPLVLTERVKEATVEASFTVEAALLRDPLGNGEDRLYAVAALSDAEAEAVREGGKVTLRCGEDRSVTGIIAALREEAADAPLLETLAGLMRDLQVPAGGLTLAVMLPDDPAAVNEGDVVPAQLVTAASKQTLSVPRNALRSDGASVYVWVYESKGASKRLVRRAVTPGLLSETEAEITGGLEKGELVAVGCTLAPNEIKDGMKVKPAKTE